MFVLLLLLLLLLSSHPSSVAVANVRVLVRHNNMSASAAWTARRLKKECVCTHNAELGVATSDPASCMVTVERSTPYATVLWVNTPNVSVRCPTELGTSSTLPSDSDSDLLPTAGSTRRETLLNTFDEDDVDAYHNWTSAEALMDTWVRDPPRGLAVTRIDLGISYEGRRIQGLCIIAATHAASSIPTVIVVGGHHAREWISVEATLRMVPLFMRGYVANRRVRAMLQSVRVCVIPNLNPDGYVFSWQPGWDGSMTKRMWRKNRHVLGNNGLVGVDLNRNYGVDWDDDSGSSSDPFDETYRGSAPLSELETNSLFTFVQDTIMRGGRVGGFVSIHSYGNQIMFPLGYNTNAFGPNEAFLRSLGASMRDAIQNVTGSHYELIKAADSYPCSGDAVDAVYEATKFAPSFTIETRPGISECCGFSLKPRYIEAATVECFTAVSVLMEYVAQVLQGSGPTTPAVDALWAHHAFQASFVTPVTQSSNFTALDWADDWARLLPTPSQCSATSVDRGGLCRTKRIALRLSASYITTEGGSLRFTHDVQSLLLHVVAAHFSHDPQLALEMHRAVYLPSWDSFSCVMVLATSSLDALTLGLMTLAGLADGNSGPPGRPLMTAAE
jgi:murein tripeptide amidase MpaA